MRVKRGWLILTLGLGTLCTGCLGGPKITRAVTSIGVSPKMDDRGMSRDRAEGRAKRGLLRLLRIGAMQFEYKAAAGASVLRLTIGPAEVGLANTRFEGLPGGVVAFASGQRRPEVVAAMAKLAASRVAARVSSDDPDRAFRLAENRALRKAVQRALGPKGNKPVYARGRLTLIQAQERVDASGAQVAYWVHVNLEKSGRLSEDLIKPLLRAAAAEHEAMGEWALAAQNLERAMKGDIVPSGPKLAHLAGLYFQAGDLHKADQTYEAAERAAIDLDILRAHLKVVEAIGDPAKVARLKKRIAEVEKMPGSGVDLPKDDFKPPETKPLQLPGGNSTSGS